MKCSRKCLKSFHTFSVFVDIEQGKINEHEQNMGKNSMAIRMPKKPHFEDHFARSFRQT